MLKFCTNYFGNSLYQKNAAVVKLYLIINKYNLMHQTYHKILSYYPSKKFKSSYLSNVILSKYSFFFVEYYRSPPAVSSPRLLSTYRISILLQCEYNTCVGMLDYSIIVRQGPQGLLSKENRRKQIKILACYKKNTTFFQNLKFHNDTRYSVVVHNVGSSKLLKLPFF